MATATTLTLGSTMATATTLTLGSTMATATTLTLGSTMATATTLTLDINLATNALLHVLFSFFQALLFNVLRVVFYYLFWWPPYRSNRCPGDDLTYIAISPLRAHPYPVLPCHNQCYGLVAPYQLPPTLVASSVTFVDPVATSTGFHVYQRP
ncbi:conserved hypothetical protein [Theileria orientalis strain Shintoku]|uniref:Uncharacterized protein n=1 Tax=Theileria orientalis strain Shintoku TaxID=869250 RepID=J4C3N3_THEOR|nr:conserved hypothetical protein [Theileria orientalis strain Shintoku]BAM40741.1 conserved hypothetical protein [Theileria orientalis strain Shintoku]|eukprot:XP_009691042.1 conserved hypothetical protein [Theileria orientalis strain Shintoku]